MENHDEMKGIELGLQVLEGRKMCKMKTRDESRNIYV